MMSDGAVEIVRGSARAVVSPSTEEEFAYINANLREMDKFEQNHFRSHCGGKVDSLDLFEKAWTIRLKGEIVGFVAIQVASGQTVFGNSRFIPMLSTKNVEHHAIDYARLTKPVLKYVASQAQPWVTDFFSLPLAKYDASVRWHEKTMGWHRVAEYDAFGERAILFQISRKELEK